MFNSSCKFSIIFLFFLKEDNEIDVENFIGSNDDGEDLLLEKLSEQTKQEFEDAEESLKDNDDETESSREYMAHYINFS